MAKERKPGRVKETSEVLWFDRLPAGRKDLLAVLLIFVLVLILFRDIVTKNMVFATEGDIVAALSWGEAGKHLEETEGIEPLWLPYIFSGMPSFGSLAYIPRDVSYLQRTLHLLGKALFLNAEMSWMIVHYFLAGIFMFLLARTWGFNHLPALIAALTFMLSPYAIGLAPGSHGSKLFALSYTPLLLLLTHTLWEKRNALSLGLLAAAVGTQFLTNHVQMVYYSLVLVGLYAAYRIAIDIKAQPLHAARNAGLFVLALAIGFAISAYVYLSVYEYTPYSIRGAGEAGLSGGLNYDYATNWSFHPFETLNYFVPSFFGFQTPYYWGWMPFTETTVYIGIVPVFLGILALAYKRNRYTIFFALFSLLILVISFGKHLPLLYDLLFNYLPYFNKFRAPSMILHLMPLTFGMLAAYGFAAFAELRDSGKEIQLAKLRKALQIALGIIGGILVIGFLTKGAVYESLSGFMFEKEGDLQQLQQQYGAQAPQVLEQLKSYRFDLLWKDYVKFALIAGAVLGLSLVYLKRRVRSFTYGFGLVVILIVDLMIIDIGFIEPKPRTDVERRFTPDMTVRMLKSDTTLYRIFPLGGLFQDDTWMYHTLQSIGGYSPAKLRIYQEMIDSCLYRGWDPAFPLNMHMVDMLNVKYVLAQGRLPEERFSLVQFDQNKNTATYLNRSLMPRAWFVENVQVARNKSEVFATMNSPQFDPRRDAVLEREPAVRREKSDSTAVRIVAYGAQHIVLEAFCSQQALLVLSEIYYPAGWFAFVDGAQTDIYKTNYILRSVVVPPGEHRIEFRFEPPLYIAGLRITNVAWGMTAILIVFGLFRLPAVRSRLRLRHGPQGNEANSSRATA